MAAMLPTRMLRSRVPYHADIREEAWVGLNADACREICLSDAVIGHTAVHEEIGRALLPCRKDAAQVPTGWKEQVGYTGGSSFQAEIFEGG